MRNDSAFAGLKPFRAVRAAALALPVAFGLTAPAAAEPVFSEPGTILASPDVLVRIAADWSFDNAGTNPRFTEAEFSTTEYYSVYEISSDESRIRVKAKTNADLNALPSPPPSPFTVTLDVTMTNDEGQTASGTITIETTYDRASAPSQPGEPEEPTFSDTQIRRAPSGVLVSASAERTFGNAGTNPRFTEAEFSTTEYFDVHRIHNGALYVPAKSSTDLNALSSPPPNPFRVTGDVAMTNDEGQTASGTIWYQTTYDRDSAPEPQQPDEPSEPSGCDFGEGGERDAAIAAVTVSVSEITNVNYNTDLLFVRFSLSNEKACMADHRDGYCLKVVVRGATHEYCAADPPSTSRGGFGEYITVGPIDGRWVSTTAYARVSYFGNGNYTPWSSGYTDQSIHYHRPAHGRR